MNARILLAYSGGLKASAAIPWLIDTYRAEVVAVALDLGQGDDLADVRQRALAAGAARCHVIDAREEFARDFVFPSLKAGALFDGRYPIPTALGRPLIAKTLVTIAKVEEASAVAHAGTGRDHLRLTDAVHALAPALRVIPCAEAWTATQVELASADRHHLLPTSDGARIDQNLWGRTVGRWFDAEAPGPPEAVFSVTRQPEQWPDEAAALEIEFARGLPIALNGVPMPPIELIDSVATIGAEHGIGRLSRVKARVNGRVSYAIYEAPAAVLLHTARAELQQFAVPGAVQRVVPTIAQAYADMIERGEWFSDLRPALDAFVNHVQQSVTGVVRLKLSKGAVTASSLPSTSLRVSAEPATLKP